MATDGAGNVVMCVQVEEGQPLIFEPGAQKELSEAFRMTMERASTEHL